MELVLSLKLFRSRIHVPQSTRLRSHEQHADLGIGLESIQPDRSVPIRNSTINLNVADVILC